MSDNAPPRRNLTKALTTNTTTSRSSQHVTSNARPDKPGADPTVKAAVISAIAGVLGAVIVAASAFAVGWLQYRGPGAPTNPGPGGAVTATTTSGSNSPGPLTTTTRPARQSVLDLTPVERDGEYLTGPQTINTKRYERTMYLTKGDFEPDCDSAWATYQLDYKYQRFQASIGLNDDSPSDAEGTFVVEVDGKEKAARTVHVASTQKIDVDLTRAFRIRLYTAEACGLHPDGTFVWIDPVLIPAS